MKERCHICGRKIKDGVEQCKVCKSGQTEKLVVGFHAVHNVNFMVNPFVNLLLTDRRLLVFEDMSNTGTQVGGGGLIGLAADKIIEKSLGNNGSMKLDIPFSTISKIESENTKKGLQLTIGLASGKDQRFTLGASFTGEAITAERFINMLKEAKA